jgi:GTPase SAR1 family protein
MKLIPHQKPKLQLPTFLCDAKINPDLDHDPLLQHMNKLFCCGLIGKAGSGKTSLLVGLIQTKNSRAESVHTLNRCFHHIFVFMPHTSRMSMKNNVFSHLPEDQLFEGVSFENLSAVYERMVESAKKEERSLLIFDDVQSFLKTKEVEVNLLHIIANRRHLRCSIFIVAQNYCKVPKQVRMAFTDVFLFNVTKAQYADVYEELVNTDKHRFQQILAEYKRHVKTEPKAFLYLNVDRAKFFIDWTEVVDDDSEDEI